MLAEVAKFFQSQKQPGVKADQSARKWFRAQLHKLRVRVPAALRKNAGDLERTVKIGHMYMFFYDPKNKSRLDYYDKYPLAIVVGRNSDGFSALNLHYIQPKHRAMLINNLRPLLSQHIKLMDRVSISYSILKQTARYMFFKPCFKRYLYAQCKSLFLRVDDDDWFSTIMLPTEKFIKGRKQDVWNDSRRSLRAK